MPTRRVAVATLRRGRRSPLSLIDGLSAYLAPILWGLPTLATTGQLPDWTMYAFAGAGVFGAGALFALNPVGRERMVLPATLTSGVDGASFLAGTVIATWVVGLPLVVLGTAVTGLATGVSLPVIVATAAVAVTLSVGAPGVALAAGLAFPSFETTSLPGDREAVSASLAASAVFTVFLSVPNAPLAYAVFVADTGRSVLFATALVAVVTTWFAGWRGFRYAATRFDEYTPSDRL